MLRVDYFNNHFNSLGCNAYTIYTCIGAARLRLYYILKEFKSREFYFFTEETPLKSRSKQTLNSKVKQRQFKQFIANHRTLPDLTH